MKLRVAAEPAKKDTKKPADPNPGTPHDDEAYKHLVAYVDAWEKREKKEGEDAGGTQQTWAKEVKAAGLKLHEAIEEISEKLAEQLHNGDFV
jgi:hypothetical protein